MKKTYFFGWTNIKWFIRELLKTLSNEDSYFSQKRVNTLIAFMSAEIGMNFYFYHMISSMTMPDVVAWGVTQFSIAGYTINQIQKEKKDTNGVPDPVTEPPIPDPPVDKGI